MGMKSMLSMEKKDGDEDGDRDKTKGTRRVKKKIRLTRKKNRRKNESGGFSETPQTLGVCSLPPELWGASLRL